MPLGHTRLEDHTATLGWKILDQTGRLLSVGDLLAIRWAGRDRIGPVEHICRSSSWDSSVVVGVWLVREEVLSQL